ncbi:ABC transporter [Colletotrichum paranaense]|uniref:ABC transporter n=1 Tax=Colletotrichum paranaense TaxID=1914294 RepID=A0ABQ9S3F5_9PEZI|nr:ABC transporter [Colletotrichum paranaense]KAK1523345.1 ABC transporter [Colletotrichum paranaense]
MMIGLTLLTATSLATIAAAYDTTFGFNGAPIIETRTLDEIHQAALAEGGIVTAWHGGDETNQQDGLKRAFESRFPGMTLNITVDVSKFHDGNIDRQLALSALGGAGGGAGALYVDTAILQTLHDYPRWDLEGALLHYQPVNFDKIHPAFRDVRGAWYGVSIFAWTFIWNADREEDGPQEFADFLEPRFKDRLVLTYPNDDDAVLYAFDLIMQQFGYEWFEKLLAQNPRWVRGTGTPVTLLTSPNTTLSATFTAGIGLAPTVPLNVSIPTNGTFVTWAQRAAIFRDAPHPEGAKLLHNFMLSDEYQSAATAAGLWSVRKDVAPPAGYPGIMDVETTNPVEFERFMGDRVRVERLKLFFEDKIGTAQGLSPLIDDL